MRDILSQVGGEDGGHEERPLIRPRLVRVDLVHLEVVGEFVFLL